MIIRAGENIYPKEIETVLHSPGSREFQEIREGIDADMGRQPLAEGTEARHVDAGGVPAILCERTGGAHDPFLVYFHGGGYCIASALAYRSFGSHLAKVCRARVLLVDYRLAPEHPFPAAVEDGFAAYRWVLDEGVQPSQVVIGGDSAGGGITAAVLLAARGRSLPLPAGGVCLSPWVDLTNSAASYRTHARSDPSFSKASAENYTAQYLPHGNVTDPLASPVFGDWEGSPSLLVLVSDAEVLHDDASRLADVARAAGAEVEYHEYPSMPHMWPFFYPSWPESQQALEQIAAFVTRVTHPA
jgi:epsilon-lactone hydrolase